MSTNFFDPYFKLSKVNNPNELLSYMDKFKYGWVDIYNKLHHEGFDNWFSLCKIISPYEVNKYKIGTCYEQSIFEYFIFKNQFHDCTDLKLIHLQQYCVSTHLFLAYKYKNNWYFFEHSFEEFKGIYGPYKLLQQCINQQKENMIQQSTKKGYKFNTGFKVTFLNPDELKKDIVGKDFYKIVKFDYEKGTTFYSGSPIQNLKYLESKFNITNNQKSYNNNCIYLGSSISLAVGFTFQWNDDMGIKFIERTYDKIDYSYTMILPKKYSYYLKKKCSIYLIPFDKSIVHVKFGLDNEYKSNNKKLRILKEIKYNFVKECLENNNVELVII